MILNLSGLRAKKLNGDVIENVKLSEALADAVNEHTSSIRWGRIAEDIYDEKDVELTEADIQYLLFFVNSDSCHIVIVFKKAIVKYLEGLLEKNNQPESVN